MEDSSELRNIRHLLSVMSKTLVSFTKGRRALGCDCKICKNEVFEK